ncbi:outer membrane channel protein TolC [Ferrimonas balearica]|uniref:outer membrane channel protein TolC n=1 Tax=Ferrimonas balearica TaxID=44012 RepID=UPI001C99BA08|nr:outer membrane channel protein TolC [Ferrimonas balearica]MBY5923424.1 outer membrane channel protein TolC [Ferrimonas balearica]MBY5995174.1 outer membrane channel protein TolC [Ferrimonas balearica]
MNFKLRSVCLALGLASASYAAQADDLLQIYQQALGKDPILLQAKANRDAAYEAIGESRASLLPQINATLGYSNSFYNREFGDREDDGFTGGLTLSQSIYNHANYVNLDLTKQAASQAELGYNLQVQGLIVRVSQAYFDVLSAQDNLDFVQANKRAIERQLEQTKQRFAVGLTAITDVHEAQAQYDLAVANEIQAQNNLENSYEALREITGMAHDNLNVLDTARFSPSNPTPSSHEQWQTIAEDSSLQLLIDRLGVEIAKQQISLAKTGHLPSIGLTASYNENAEFTNTPDNGEGSVGVQVQIPIFSGLAVSSQVKQANYNYVGAQQSLEETHRNVVRNLRASLNNVNASISSIRAFEQSVISAESALKATEAGFEVGTRTIVDVLNSTQQLYSAKQQLSDARYGYIIAVLALKQAAGTLSEEDVSMINQGLRQATAADSDGDQKQ